MYDLKKRAYFTTLGELRMLLSEMPNETEVCSGGVLGSYLHFDKERDLISFDDEHLDPDYDLDGYPGDACEESHDREDKEHGERILGIAEDRQCFFVGDKFMRTYLASGGSWDYELYDISLSIVDSGQLGENENMTRNEVIDTVLSWNRLEGKVKHYITLSEDVMEHFENQGICI